MDGELCSEQLELLEGVGTHFHVVFLLCDQGASLDFLSWLEGGSHAESLAVGCSSSTLWVHRARKLSGHPACAGP